MELFSLISWYFYEIIDFFSDGSKFVEVLEISYRTGEDIQQVVLTHATPDHMRPLSPKTEGRYPPVEPILSFTLTAFLISMSFQFRLVYLSIHTHAQIP